MIDQVLAQLAKHLNGHFRRTLQVGEDMAVVSNLMELGGTPVAQATNKLVLFLSGVERDTLAHRPREASWASTGSTIEHAAPVYLNLLVMCAANFSGSHYPEALKFLSTAIAYFQGNPSLDHQNTPDMDARLEALNLNMENLSSHEMHSLWGIHGGRYVPSVLFRIRMITLQAGAVRSREATIRQVDSQALP